MTSRARRVLLAALAWATAADARDDALFGRGARSGALAASDVADADPTVAAVAGPTRASSPGLRAQLGYRVAHTRMTLGGAPAGLLDHRGVDLDLQLARRVGPVDLGVAASMHLPDGGAAWLAFRPRSEPVWLRWDAGSERATFDGVAAVSHRASGVGLALGASVSASSGGRGVDLSLPQDERGPHADGAADVELAYRAAPIVGASWERGPVALAARYRGATSIPVALPTTATVSFHDNPLNGVTTVRVDGVVAYDPAALTLASRARAGAWTLTTAVDYTRWSAAPPVAASLAIDVRLGLEPYTPSGVASRPRLRDTVTPRLGLSLDRAWWSARVGAALEPSASPGAPTDVIDPTRTALSLGGGVALPRAAGVEAKLDAFAAWHHLWSQRLSTSDATRPFSGAIARGDAWIAGASLRGALP
ncbi:MAG: hypothetical protein IT374_14120 [Polyangiaceae bacterium]|nr:hypothetical protein [Polyangiaceae bacterium]